VATLDDKLESPQAVDTDPCGAVTAAPVTPESAEWYESVRNHRYGVYAPVAAGVMDAGRWRGADVLEIGVGVGSDSPRLCRGRRAHAAARSVGGASAPHHSAIWRFTACRPRRGG